MAIINTNDLPKHLKERIEELEIGKQDSLVAGTGITIAADGKTISASGGSRTLTVRTELPQDGNLVANSLYKLESLSTSKELELPSDAVDGDIVEIRFQTDAEIDIDFVGYFAITQANIECEADTVVFVTAKAYDFGDDEIGWDVQSRAFNFMLTDA